MVSTSLGAVGRGPRGRGGAVGRGAGAVGPWGPWGPWGPMPPIYIFICFYIFYIFLHIFTYFYTEHYRITGAVFTFRKKVMPGRALELRCRMHGIRETPLVPGGTVADIYKYIYIYIYIPIYS